MARHELPLLAADMPAEDLSRLALDALPTAIYMTDAQGVLTYFNNAAAELWGYRPPLGKARWCGSWQLQSPDGQPLAHQDCPMAIAIKEKRAIKGAPAVAIRPDGSSVPFLAFPAPLIGESGEVEGAVNLLVDTSRHRQAEELTYRLAAIVESSDDAIISKNLNGIITSWNRGAERLFGYSANEMIGKHVTRLIPKGRENEEDAILASIGRGERVAHFDTIRRRKDGTTVHVSLTVSPIRNAYGVIIGASKIARDITERKDSENRIRMLMREVNHRVKNQFAVILSMIRETNKRAATAAEFDRQIRDRIMALSRSHDLLVDGEWRGATLHDLVVAQVQPFSDDNRISASGELIVLSAAAVQYLGIAFHELATNSARHGALSTNTGRVEISWTILEGQDPHLRLTWTETGGPAVGEISRSGFGRVVLERVAPSAVNGVGHISYAPSGIVWTLDAPLKPIEAAGNRAEP